MCGTENPGSLTLLSDAAFQVFKKWRCYDDFEGMGLHGAFLVDANGQVRWADVGYEPFMDAAFLLKDCRVPAANLLGKENAGVNVLMRGLDYERVVLSGGPLGLMAAALDVAVPYVRERKQFGRPIGTFQLMQGKVADMYVALNSARAYVYAVAKACDGGRTTRFDAAGAILLASENAVRTTLEAIQALGGAGYTKDYPVERLLRDAKLYDIGAGTNEIRRFLIGRELIGG